MALSRKMMTLERTVRDYQHDRAKLIAKIDALKKKNQQLDDTVKYLKSEPTCLRKAVHCIQLSHESKPFQHNMKHPEPWQQPGESRFSSESDN